MPSFCIEEVVPPPSKVGVRVLVALPASAFSSESLTRLSA